MIGEKVNKCINMVQIFNLQVMFIHCDNANENKKKVEDVARKHNIQWEFTSPDTLQMNGAVEHCIFTLELKSQAMLQQTSLNNDARNKLWAEAVRCANAVKNVLMTDP